MTPAEFCYWLKGFFDLAESETDRKFPITTLNSGQVTDIRNQLKKVFEPTITYQMSDPKFQQKMLEDVLKRAKSKWAKNERR